MNLTLSIISLLFLCGTSTTLWADSWRLPEKAKYYSPNKTFCFEVIPRKLESQLKYFEDKVAGKPDAGANKNEKDNETKGIFYISNSNGRYVQKHEFPLVNAVSPVDAIVSNKGDYVVTFDNWHSVGYGDNVVVIYQSNGQLVKKFGLEDLLTKDDTEMFSESVSSKWWGQGHWIDDAKGLLVLRVVSNGISPWDDKAKFLELKIQLATGKPLEEKRDLFPARYSVNSFVVSSPSALATSPSDLGKSFCASSEASFDSPDATRFPSGQLYAKAIARPLPLYPPIAKAARAEGDVIIELLVSKDGDVICARTISGDSLLRDAAIQAALKWKFEPIAISGTATKIISVIAFNFRAQT